MTDAIIPNAAPMTARARLRAIFGGAAGNLVEWYDWYAYSAFTLYFAKSFFPQGDQTSQLVQAALVFAVGFLARPLGAWIMGLYADRAGRRAALALSVGMMCFGSLVIAVCPTYAQIGAAAPAVLVAARILQGLSVGGEYGASATYMSEMAGARRRGFWSSFQYVTLVGGQLLAVGTLIVLQNTLTPEALDEWGWRIPFAIGAGLAIVVFLIRLGIAESASFENARGQERARTMMLFLRYPKESLMVAGITAGGSLAFYAYTTYMQKFLVNTAGFSRDDASAINAATLVVFMLVQPLYGWLSDIVGRRPMLVTAFALNALIAIPLFTALGATTSQPAAFALCMTGLLVTAFYTSVGTVVKAELFPANVRALGVALPYAIATATFGGTAEYVALSLKDIGFEQGFYFYVAGMSALALLVAFRMRDTRDKSLIVED